MIQKFEFLYDDDGTFTDYSLDANEYGRDEINIPSFVASEDRILVGLYKPFDRMYFEMKTPISGITLTAKQYISGSFSAPEFFYDESKGFSRSGYLRWPRSENWQESTINGISAYWVELTSDIDWASAVDIQGASLVFSTDQDLVAHYHGIDCFLGSSRTSFILNHEEALKEIVQMIRNRGQVKQGNDDTLKHITRFDFFRIDEEVRQASKYKTLEFIFRGISNDPDGIFQLLANKFERKFSDAFETLILTLDEDDDGVIDAKEDDSLRIRTGDFIRV